jgi:RimJ/RimL family protein N-acetyltransferase
MPGPVFISGDRVDLRVIEREDVPFLQRSRNNPELRTPLVFTEPRTHEQMETFYEERIAEENGDAQLLVCEPDGDPVGVVNLYDVRHDHGEIAYWLVPAAQGKGYATEAVSLLVEYAFETRGLHRVYAKAAAFNDDSRRLLERLGFSEEGRLREHLFLDGAYHDEVWYGLLREEWDGREA